MESTIISPIGEPDQDVGESETVQSLSGEQDRTDTWRSEWDGGPDSQKQRQVVHAQVLDGLDIRKWTDTAVIAAWGRQHPETRLRPLNRTNINASTSIWPLDSAYGFAPIRSHR